MAEDARGLPPLPGAEALTGTGLAHGEVPGGRRRQNFWQVVGLMGLPDHDEVHGRGWKELTCPAGPQGSLCSAPAQSPALCTSYREGGREGRTERRNIHTMWISDIHTWNQIGLFK